MIDIKGGGAIKVQNMLLRGGGGGIDIPKNVFYQEKIHSHERNVLLV